MKTKIIQYFVGNDEKYLELCKVSEQLNKKYAELHNYDYVFEYIPQKTIEDYYGVCDYEKIIAYKVKLMYDHLMKQDNELLVFIDADAAVSNPTLKIEELIDEEHEIFLSRGNQKLLQILLLDDVRVKVNNLFKNPDELTNKYYQQIMAENNLFYDFEWLSIGHILLNGGFLVIKNTELMRNLFKDSLTIQHLLIDTVFKSKSQDERAIGLCLLKRKYYQKHAFMYQQVQGGIANSFGTKYSEDLTFLLHDYGKATTKEQKIERMKNLLNNKWWSQVK